MNIQCNQQNLMEAVLNVQRAVSTRTTIPTLEGILLKAEKNNLYLYGYDLELGITTHINAKILEEGKIVLNAKLFSEIIRKLPNENVQLIVEKDLTVIITCGNSKFSITGLDGDEYPTLPDINSNTSMKLPSNILKSMIKQTIFSVSTDTIKPIYTGTLFEVTSNEIKLISVDGCRLAMRCEPISANLDDDYSFVVPSKALNEVLKILTDDTTVTVLLDSKYVIFEVDSYRFISRLLQGDFLDYNSSIPTTCSTELTISTKSLISSIERVSLIITEKLKTPVRAIFSRSTLKLSCSTSVGMATDELNIETYGDPVETGFNDKYFLEALKNAETDEVKIQLNGSLSPIKIVPKDGNSFLFLVLPVRFKN